MSKKTSVFEKAIEDIKNSKRGKIGEKYLSLRKFATTYQVSYVTATKVYEELEKTGAIFKKAKNYYISDCKKSKIQEKRQLLFGVHVRDIKNPFYSCICYALAETAKKKNVQLIFMSSNYDNDEKKSILRKFIELGCNGVINLNSFNEQTLFDFYKIYPLPFVFFGIPQNDSIYADYVLTDNKLSGKHAAKHLIDCGAETLFYITSKNRNIKEDERFLGFKSYLTANDVTDYTLTVFEDDSSDSDNLFFFGNQLYNASRNKKVGVFCHHDGLAITVFELCNRKKIKIPDEVMILGYDDLQATSYTTPQISTFAYDYNAIAESCISCLTERLKKSNEKSSSVVFPTYLVIRGSTKSN